MARRNRDDDGGRAARIRDAMTSSQEAFFNECWPWLLHILLSQASDSGLAEEAAAETVAAALDKWDDLVTYDRPDSWLYKVATRRLRRIRYTSRVFLFNSLVWHHTPTVGTGIHTETHHVIMFHHIAPLFVLPHAPFIPFTISCGLSIFIIIPTTFLLISPFTFVFQTTYLYTSHPLAGIPSFPFRISC